MLVPWNQPQASNKGSEPGDGDEDLKDFCLRTQGKPRISLGLGSEVTVNPEPGLSQDPIQGQRGSHLE